MRIRFLLLLCLMAFAALTACGGGLPTPDALYGTWTNTDAGTVRAFVFAASDEASVDLAGKTPVYHLYSYPEGSSPVEVQRGTYDIVESSLVTTVTWDTSSQYTGQSFANEIQDYDTGTLTLSSDSAASGSREFTSAAALP